MRKASCNIHSPSLYRGTDTLFWTRKGQRACQTVLSWHFTIGWKLTSTHYFISAQLCLVLSILAQELLLCSHEYVRNLCVLFKPFCWRSAIHQGGHMDVMARRTNESEKINKNLQRSTGVLSNDGDLLQTLPFQAFGPISESSASVETSALLSK